MKPMILAACIAFAASPSFAQSNLSAELMLGTADQKSTVADGQSSGDATSFGARGVYSHNENIAFEVAYQNYGEFDQSYQDEEGDTVTDTISSTAFNVGVKGSIPLENGFSIHGRVGIAFWDYDGQFTFSTLPGAVFDFDDSGNDFYYGIGAQYSLNEKWTIGAEYTITEMDVSVDNIAGFAVDEFAVDHEVKNLTLTLGYSF